jgi:hypothetical protein
MNTLLLEYLSTLLEAAPRKREFKAVSVGDDGTERVASFASKEKADAAVVAGTHRPYYPDTDAKLEKEPSKRPTSPAAIGQTSTGNKDVPSSGRIKTPTVDSQDYATDAVTRERLRTNLGKISRLMQNLRARGVAGAGGPVASQGESLFTQFTDVMHQRGGIGAIVETRRQNRAFAKLVGDHAMSGPVKGSRFNFDATQSKKRRNIREVVASDFGFKDYDDGNENHRRRIGEYLATREIYVNKKLEEAKNACAGKKEHVFCKSGKAGFGKKEKPYIEWLETGFDGAVRLDGLIRSGQTRLDPSREYFTLQSDPTAESQAAGISPDAIVLRELSALRGDAASQEDRDHYDYQIKIFEKLSYHDTFMVGYDVNGRLTVLHDSNKKSNDLSDPHNNTTPETRLVRLKEQYNEERQSPELRAAAEEMIKVIDDELEEVRTIKAASGMSASQLEITDSMIMLAESSHMESYMEEITRLATTTPRKGNFATFVNNELARGVTWKKLPTAVKLELVQRYIELTPESAYASFSYAFVKMGELAQVDTIMRDVFGDAIESAQTELGPVIGVKETEAGAVQKTYQFVVRSLQERDKADGHTSPPRNGRHVQSYVDSVFSALHINTYIDNYDADMVMSIGRHAVTPREVRDTLVAVLPEDVVSAIDIDSPAGKKFLKQYLRENCAVDATSGAIVMSTPDGDCAIGTDVWRTAGKTPKVATSYGICFRQKLREKTSQKKIPFFSSEEL